MEPTLESRVRRREDCLSAAVDDELVLMSVDRGAYFGLDAIGRVVWEGLAEPVRVADLCARLEERYDGAPSDIEADVLAFLRGLAAKDLIVVED